MWLHAPQGRRGSLPHTCFHPLARSRLGRLCFYGSGVSWFDRLVPRNVRSRQVKQVRACLQDPSLVRRSDHVRGGRRVRPEQQVWRPVLLLLNGGSGEALLVRRLQVGAWHAVPRHGHERVQPALQHAGCRGLRRRQRSGFGRFFGVCHQLCGRHLRASASAQTSPTPTPHSACVPQSCSPPTLMTLPNPSLPPHPYLSRQGNVAREDEGRNTRKVRVR